MRDCGHLLSNAPPFYSGGLGPSPSQEGRGLGASGQCLLRLSEARTAQPSSRCGHSLSAKVCVSVGPLPPPPRRREALPF